MSTAHAVRLKIEHALETRFPAALSPAQRTIRETVSTGIDAVDRLLDGGIPVGAISELAGPVFSGRTSLAMAYIAQQTHQERICAWVDVGDTFDPESAAAAGVVLPRLLWVRCSDAPMRKGRNNQFRSVNDRIWARLDQLLRATDLLLQTAGFAAVVMDIGDVSPECARRIPLATWFRFRQAADRSRTSLIVLTRTPCAQSSAEVLLHCAPRCVEDAGNSVLEKFTFSVQRERQRFVQGLHAQRKQPASEWSAFGSWVEKERA